MKRTLSLLLVLALILALLSGCTAKGAVVSLPDVGVTFTVPEGWVCDTADQGEASPLVAEGILTADELAKAFGENGYKFYAVQLTDAPAVTAAPDATTPPAKLPRALYAIYTVEEIPALTTDDETVDREKFNDAIIATLNEGFAMPSKAVATAVINRHNGTYAFLQYPVDDTFVGYLVGMGGKTPYVIMVTTMPDTAFPMEDLFELVDSIKLTK